MNARVMAASGDSTTNIERNATALAIDTVAWLLIASSRACFQPRPHRFLARRRPGCNQKRQWGGDDNLRWTRSNTETRREQSEELPQSELASADFYASLLSSTDSTIRKIISWTSDGLSVAIFDEEAFHKTVEPSYFPGHKHEVSFRSALCAYGFNRQKDVPLVFGHPKIKRGSSRAEFHALSRSQSSKDRRRAAAAKTTGRYPTREAVALGGVQDFGDESSMDEDSNAAAAAVDGAGQAYPVADVSLPAVLKSITPIDSGPSTPLPERFMQRIFKMATDPANREIIRVDPSGSVGLLDLSKFRQLFIEKVGDASGVFEQFEEHGCKGGAGRYPGLTGMPPIFMTYRHPAFKLDFPGDKRAALTADYGFHRTKLGDGKVSESFSLTAHPKIYRGSARAAFRAMDYGGEKPKPYRPKWGKIYPREPVPSCEQVKSSREKPRDEELRYKTPMNGEEGSFHVLQTPVHPSPPAPLSEHFIPRIYAMATNPANQATIRVDPSGSVALINPTTFRQLVGEEFGDPRGVYDAQRFLPTIDDSDGMTQKHGFEVGAGKYRTIFGNGWTPPFMTLKHPAFAADFPEEKRATLTLESAMQLAKASHVQKPKPRPVLVTSALAVEDQQDVNSGSDMDISEEDIVVKMEV
uniref:HSF-type DNA-binding domain-containing protein n=1 Tax=Mycena chlorophos TaxID=658473 RepID=A0ABQ0LEB0_MYCCL|nr:predicted protein [Mycena chlorophos]